VDAGRTRDPKYDYRVEGEKGGGPGLFVASLSTHKGPFTVVGNITSAPIVLEGGRPLPDPWHPLNVVSP
jgi:hypothetical protein